MALYDLVRPARRKTWVSPVERLRQAEEARESRAARAYAKQAKRTLKREAKALSRPFAPHPILDAPIIQIPTDGWSYRAQAGTVGTWYNNTTWPVSNYTASSATTIYNQWTNNWIGTTQATGSVYQWYADGSVSEVVNSWPVVEEITPEEADRRLRETRARAFKAQIERQRAVRKGRRLLVDLLDDLQKWDYAKTGSFLVAAADGKLYRLRKNGTTHELGADGAPAFSHCIHLAHSYIAEDSLVACKLLLETDPAEFRRIANTSPLRSTPAAALAHFDAAVRNGDWARALAA